MILKYVVKDKILTYFYLKNNWPAVFEMFAKIVGTSTLNFKKIKNRKKRRRQKKEERRKHKQSHLIFCYILARKEQG